MQRIKHIFLVLICLFAVNNAANAQLFQAIVSGGLNLAQVEGDEVSGFFKAGLTAGVGVMMPLQPNNLKGAWRASMELIYNQRGAYERDIFSTKAPFGYSLTLHYVDVPVMIHYKEPRLDFMLGLGLQYGRLFKINENWLLPEPAKLGLYRPLPLDADKPVSFDNLPSFNSNELSIVVDARFRIWQRLKCSIRWQYGLTSLRSNIAFSNGMPPNSPDYFVVKRDYHNHWISVRLLYVINERLDSKKDRNINKNQY